MFYKLLAFCLRLFSWLLSGSFSTLVREVVLAKSLISLRNAVPTSAVLLDAPLLHIQINQFLLLLTDMPEVMQEVPAIHGKSILDVVKQCLLARGRDIIVGTWVACLGVRNANSHLVLPLKRRKEVIGLAALCQLYQLRLYATLPKHHWLGTAVTVNEPLAQIRWHFYVDKIVTHEVQLGSLKCCKYTPFKLY